MEAIDLALTGGRVRTLDPGRPQAEAVAVAGGDVVAVGTDAEVEALAGPGTERVDLGGAAVTPGIIDSHLHPFSGALHARGADLMGARTLEEVRRRVAQERARCAPGEWVLGYGLDYNAFEHTGIRHELIADAAQDAPALLLFEDLHVGLATPRALELAGATGPRHFDGHAEIVLDAGGAPTGELREIPALDVVREAIPALTAEARYRLFAGQLRRFAAVGITSAHAMDGDLSTHDLLRELEDRGDLVIRLRAPFWIHPESTEEEWAAFAEHRDARGRRWSAGIVKFFIDGVIDAGTGWLYEPDTEGMGLDPFWPDPARYREAVRFFARRGFQCVTHATGDRGVREALDAYRDARPSTPAPGVRHRIEHIETLQPQDLPRFAAEGVVASMQAQHMMWLMPDRSDNWSRRLGPERCERAFPIRSILETGAVVSLGSDWPVARYDPREGLAAARLRRAPGDTGREPYDDEALTPLQALEGYTTGAALVAGEQDRLGRIAPGRAADLTVFATDPVECDADALVEDEVLLTVVDGEIVHRAI